MSDHPPNQMTFDNRIPDLMDQMQVFTEQGDFKEALTCSLMLLSHMMYRIQELEGSNEIR